jgi:hypothetical protein
MASHIPLRIELESLITQQREAMARATFVSMSADESQAYEQRARRITALQHALGMEVSTPDTIPGRW